ncbi:hypothetical protein ENBRE01_2164 [Enteropsectra breve]|nr:hypothetical protein ENBRE01_2164 [Enteropsectra breve]
MESETKLTDIASNVLKRVEQDMANALIFQRIDLNNISISYIHVGIVFTALSTALILAYLLTLVLHVKIFKLVFFFYSIIMPLLACLSTLVFSFIGATVYSDILNDGHRFFIKYMYAILLYSLYAPLVIIIDALVPSLHYLTFLAFAIGTEYVARDVILSSRTFQSDQHRTSFTVISLLMYVGYFCILFPLFF